MIVVPKCGQKWYAADCPENTVIIVWADHETVVYNDNSDGLPTRFTADRESFVEVWRMVEPVKVDRILRNADGTIDEIVVHDCTVHFEQMDDDEYWMSISKTDDPSVSVTVWWYARKRKPYLSVCTTEEDIEWDNDDQHEPWTEEEPT